MFTRQRVFSQSNHHSGLSEWFVETREGIMGPYATRDYAEQMLKSFKSRCVELGSHGGRTLQSSGDFTMADEHVTVRMDGDRHDKL